MRRGRSYTALTDGDLVHCAGTAAEQARRSDPTVIHQERGLGLAAQQPDLVVDPEAAAVPTGAPRAFAQRKTVEQDGVMLFQNLDRLGLRDPDARAAVGQTIGLPPAAVPTTAEQVHDVMAVLFGVVAAQPKIAAGAGRRCEKTLRDCFSHRSEHRLHDPLRHLGSTAGNRTRIASIEKGAV